MTTEIRYHWFDDQKLLLQAQNGTAASGENLQLKPATLADQENIIEVDYPGVDSSTGGEILALTASCGDTGPTSMGMFLNAPDAYAWTGQVSESFTSGEGSASVTAARARNQDYSQQNLAALSSDDTSSRLNLQGQHGSTGFQSSKVELAAGAVGGGVEDAHLTMQTYDGHDSVELRAIATDTILSLRATSGQTQHILEVYGADGVLRFAVATDGSPLLLSPNGGLHKLQVANDGTLSTASAT